MQQRSRQAGQFLPDRLALFHPPVAGQRLNFLPPDLTGDGIYHIFMEQDLRDDVVGFSLRQHRQHLVPAVGPQEGLDLPLDPDRLLGVGRTNYNQKIGILQGPADVIGQMAGDGQFLFIPKQAHGSAAAFFDGSGNLKPFQTLMNLLCDPDVIGMMPVRYKGVVMDVHVAPPLSF